MGTRTLFATVPAWIAGDARIENGGWRTDCYAGSLGLGLDPTLTETARACGNSAGISSEAGRNEGIVGTRGGRGRGEEGGWGAGLAAARADQQRGDDDVLRGGDDEERGVVGDGAQQEIGEGLGA